MSRFWSDIVHHLTPYVPGEQPRQSNLIKLNTNESPYGPSPAVIAAIKEEVGENLRLYPDPGGEALKQAVATFYGIDSQQVFVGNGSDEILALVFQALLHHPKGILIPDITYSFYPTYCKLYDIDYTQVPVKEDFSIDPADYQSENGGIVIANPNAPTGLSLSLDAIERIAGANPNSVVVIDEAYVDFGAQSAVSLIDRYPNLLVVQTLSKSRALAGLRVGFAIGDKELIAGLERVKNSFNCYPLDRMAIRGGVAAMTDRAYFEDICQRVINTRENLRHSLASLGFEVVPSTTNFLFARHPQFDAKDLQQALRNENIIVRHFNAPRIDQHLRISVGTDEECARLVEVLEQICQAR